MARRIPSRSGTLSTPSDDPSSVGSKRGVYLLPMYPAAALLAGKLGDEIFSGEAPKWMEAWARWALRFLGGFLGLAAAGSLGAVIYALAKGVNRAEAVSLLPMGALAAGVFARAIWVWAVAVASLRRAPWSRAAAIVWQILQLSIAVGAFQGLFARADVGWALLVPAITIIGLLLWTPVRIAYSRPDDRPETA